jgi:hypothetical protein
MKAPCQHKRGEYSYTYQHCFDCGREVTLIGGKWFDVEAWIRVSHEFLKEARAAEPSKRGD